MMSNHGVPGGIAAHTALVSKAAVIADLKVLVPARGATPLRNARR